MLNTMNHKLKSLKNALRTRILPILVSLSMICPMMMFPIRAKASTQISAWTDFQRTYQGNSYDFHVYGTQAQGLPNNYSFNSDVIDFVISKSGDAYNHTLYDSGIYLIDWEINTAMDITQGIMSLFANAYIALNSAMQDYVYRDWRGVYLWEFEFTGADENYFGAADYGTAYGFTFHGLCGDKIDLVLDSSGDFYGQNRIGNWTYSTQTPEYIPHIIHQADPDNIWVPNVSTGNFNDLKPPYISGKSLHFFYYIDDVEHHVIIDDFRDTSIDVYPQIFGDGSSRYYIYFWCSTGRNMTGTIDGNTISFTYNNAEVSINNENLTFSGTLRRSYFEIPYSNTRKSFVLSNWQNAGDPRPNYNCLGFYNNTAVMGHSNIYINTVPYTQVTPNPDPTPVDVPIPVEQIPSDPEDPIPDNPTPDPVPGITYPEPAPLPLPPFATIVSGNDDMWGQTIELQGLENSLLPYLGSLSEFEFPSFTDLFDEYTASIIWVAQIMSLLYNGTPLNILFIALCLFSLVSVLIGAYKLWNGTEPDPVNGGRRWKRPPKGGKRH